jgi:predicted MFS family arabinose efflux permease
MAVYGVIAIILALIFIKNRPEDIGELPDGEVAEGDAQSTASAPAKPSRVYKNNESVTLKQALRRPAFYLIVLALSAGFYAFSNNAGCAVAHFTTQGFDPAMIAAGVSVLGICMMAGVFLVGIISDFVEPLRLIGFLGIFAALALFIAAFFNQDWTIFVYYALVGLTFGGISNLVPTAIANFWGRDHFPKILGTAMMIGGFVTSWAGTIGGAIFEATGAYTNAFILGAVIIIICALCGIFIKIPKAEKTQ